MQRVGPDIQAHNRLGCPPRIFFGVMAKSAVAITQANGERDDTTVIELFTASGIVFEAALDEMSPEYRKIAAPWVGPDPTS